MITKIINRAKKNPIITFSWTVFTFCIGYLVTHEMTFPDRVDNLEKVNIEISVSRMEHDRANKLIKVYTESCEKVTIPLKTINTEIEANLSKITDKDMPQIISMLIDARRELSKPIVLLKNSHFENEPFRDFVHTLLADIEYLDAYIAKRMTFLELTRNDFAQAEKMKQSLNNVEEERKLIEISSRAPLFEYYNEKTIREDNAKLRTAQRNEKLNKLQSNLAIGAWAYIGGFIVVWVGFVYSQRNRRKKASVNAPLESGGDRQDTSG